MPRSPTPARQNGARRGPRVARHDTSLDPVQTVSRVGATCAEANTWDTRPVPFGFAQGRLSGPAPSEAPGRAGHPPEC
jgi:hypothetical protein